MHDNQEKLEELVKNHFDVKVTSWGEYEDFDATNMITVHNGGKETVSNKGHFSVQNFTDNIENRYKLVQYSGNFVEDDELVTFMKDAEHSAVKDYELVHPKSSLKGYTLYRLIPHTVQGEPQW